MSQSKKRGKTGLPDICNTKNALPLHGLAGAGLSVKNKLSRKTNVHDESSPVVYAPQAVAAVTASGGGQF